MASEARTFDVWNGKEELRFEFDGKPFTSAELQSLEGYLFPSDEVPPRLQNLAIALSGASSLASHLEFRSENSTLSRADGGYQITCSGLSKRSVLRVAAHKSFLGRFKDHTPKLQEVLSVCRFAPLSIRINNNYPSWSWTFQGPVIHRTLKTSRRIGYPPSAYDCHKQEVDSPGPYGGVIALVKEQNPRDLLVVVHGISHPVPIDAPHMEGVLWHDGLTRDLSCTQLVHDQKMTQFLGELKAQIAGMVLERVVSQEAFRAEDRQMLEPLAARAAAHFEQQGDIDSAERLRQWSIADDREGPDIETPEGYSEFQSRLKTLGDSPEGAALRARALELLLEKMRSLTNEHQWVEAESVVDRMRPLFSPPKPELESLAQALAILNRGERTDLRRESSSHTEHLQDGLVALYLGDWSSAERSLQLAGVGYKREANVLLAHGYLGRDNPGRALQAAEAALEAATTTERFLLEQPARRSDAQRYIERNAVYRELVADCFLAMNRPLEALDMRVSSLPGKPQDRGLQALRLRYIKGQAAGLWSFWESVKWHVRAARADWEARDEQPYYIPGHRRKEVERLWNSLDKYLEHRLDKPEIEVLFEPRLTDLGRTLFYVGRVAQEMRLRGQAQQAEQLVARWELTLRARALCLSLVYGAKKG